MKQVPDRKKLRPAFRKRGLWADFRFKVSGLLLRTRLYCVALISGEYINYGELDQYETPPTDGKTPNKVTKIALRQEYVRKKSDAYFSGLLYGLFFVPALIVFILMVSMSLFCVLTGIWIRALDVVLAGVFPGCFACVLANFARSCWNGVKDAKQTLRMPYVPPVTPDTLPADEILVRGSAEPLAAQSEVLLRAAQGVESPQDELLRVTKE